MRVTILSKLKKMAIDNLCMWANFIYIYINIYMTKTNGSVVVAQGPCLFLARINFLILVLMACPIIIINEWLTFTISCETMRFESKIK